MATDQSALTASASKRTSLEANPKLRLVKLLGDLHSRSNYGLDTSRDFYLSTLNYVAELKGTSNAQVRLDCLLECLRFFFLQGRTVEALRAASHLHDLAKRTRNKVWMRKAESSYGLIYAENGQLADAVMHYSRALEHAQAVHEVSGEVTVLVNLGVALNYGSLYRDAIPCLQKAQALATGFLNADQFEAAALCNLAQSFHSLEEYSAGFDAISQCLALSAEPSNAVTAFQRTVRELTFVQLALDMGRNPLAAIHAAECEKYARRADTTKAFFLASLARGLYEIHAGSVEKGLQVLQSALSSPVTDVTLFRADALAALVRAYDEAGRPEDALAHLKELLAHVKRSRAASLLALQSFATQRVQSFDHAAQLDLRSLDMREARLRARVAERQVEEAQREMFERLAVAADLKEESSGQHGYRVGSLSALLAKEYGWSADECRNLEMAARLHDIGKNGIPDRILLSSDALAEADRHFITAHTLIGSEMLSQGGSKQMNIAEQVARFHHEWWDGNGYPSKLKGKRIPIHARIVAIADFFDALTHGRPYAEAWSIDRAIAEITARSGTQFDPELVALFTPVVEYVRCNHSDMDAFLGRASRASPVLQAREKIRELLAKERKAGIPSELF